MWLNVEGDVHSFGWTPFKAELWQLTSSQKIWRSFFGMLGFSRESPKGDGFELETHGMGDGWRKMRKLENMKKLLYQFPLIWFKIFPSWRTVRTLLYPSATPYFFPSLCAVRVRKWLLKFIIWGFIVLPRQKPASHRLHFFQHFQHFPPFSAPWIFIFWKMENIREQ